MRASVLSVVFQRCSPALRLRRLSWTAIPVHQDTQRCWLDIDDDLSNHRAHDPLLEIERCSFVAPQARQIPGELMQVLFLLLGKRKRRWIELRQGLLQTAHTLQRPIPAAFESPCHKAIFWLDCIILTPVTAGLETGALKFQFKLLPFLCPRFGQLICPLSKRLHPDRRERCQNGSGNRLLNLETAT